MNSIPPRVTSDEERLGVLAMNFRGTRSDTERQAIANDYAQTVQRLIQSGSWDEMPPPEDQLSDAWMPAECFTHWSDPPASP
jgi:hypothetical protein